MLSKNIPKFLFFVTIFCITSPYLVGCKAVSSSFSAPPKNTTDYDFSDAYDPPQVIGTIKSDEITESSGIVASRCNPKVLWTHNDSGDKNLIYALDYEGKKLGTFRVTDADNSDWEDIATLKDKSGQCFLYIGDIGNNLKKKTEMTIYRVKEPVVSGDTDSNKKNPIDTAPAEAISFSYPDGAHNAETLMVHPETGDIYIVTKEEVKPAGVYKLAANYSLDKINSPQIISDYTVPAIPNGLLTGGEISPDGKHVVLCDYFAGYEITLPTSSKNFDDIWKEKPVKINLGERAQGEAIGYSVDGKSMYATSEKKNSPLIKVVRK